MKYEWKKQEKNLYLPKETPELVTVPKQKFFMLSGQATLTKRILQKGLAFYILWLMPCG